VQGIVLATFPACTGPARPGGQYTAINSALDEMMPSKHHKIAIGLTGDPVPVGSRSGAITHRNDQRPISAHA